MSLRLFSQSILYHAKHLFHDPEEFLTMLGVKASDHILQIGCSSGYYTKPLARIAKKGKVYAIGSCAKTLARVKTRCRNDCHIETICCSPDAFVLPRSSLDKVFCFNGLHKLSNIKQSLSLWTEFLKDGGKLFCPNHKISPQAIRELTNGKLNSLGTLQGMGVFIKSGSGLRVLKKNEEFSPESFWDQESEASYW
jgi:ubiquinone/menaquinone biosynthesis C-methylase UbiE